MSSYGMSPDQCTRFETWQHIASTGIKAAAKTTDIADPLVMHVVGPSSDQAKRDLVVIFEGLDLGQQEVLQGVLGPWCWESLLKRGGRLTDEITLRIKWKKPVEPGVHDAQLSIEWEDSHMQFPVMVREQDDNY
jgi:hypothetical protein